MPLKQKAVQMGIYFRFLETQLLSNKRTPPIWIMLVPKSSYNRVNISTKHQIVFLREKFCEFVLEITKETYFIILVGKIPPS
jgi:hypothetical protein